MWRPAPGVISARAPPGTHPASLPWPDDVQLPSAWDAGGHGRGPVMTRELCATLEERVRRDGSRPLVTWYDLDRGARVELSARTFANWVDKTVNLMTSVGADDRPLVGLPLLVSDPGHWVGLVWAMAAWQLGGEVQAERREALDAVDLAVVGPHNTHPVPGVETVACSLHPLGLGFATPQRAVIDYAEVTGQPDAHWSVPASDTDTAFRAGGTVVSAGDVDRVPGAPRRLAVRVARGDAPWALLETSLVAPILGGGSIVVLIGGTDEAVGRVLTTEGAEAIPVAGAGRSS